MRTMSPLFQLMRTKQLGVLDDLAEASLGRRHAETRSHGVGHVLVSVDPAGTLGAYQATITTPAGTAPRGPLRRVIANEYADKGQIIRTPERPLANQPASELDGTFSRCDVRIIPARHYAGRKTGFMD